MGGSLGLLLVCEVPPVACKFTLIVNILLSLTWRWFYDGNCARIQTRPDLTFPTWLKKGRRR